MTIAAGATEPVKIKVLGGQLGAFGQLLHFYIDAENTLVQHELPIDGRWVPVEETLTQLDSDSGSAGEGERADQGS